MSSDKPLGLSTPMAIVIGSVVISSGLYFGLRSGNGAKNDGPPAQPEAMSAASQAPVSRDVAPTAKPLPSVDKTSVVREVIAVLEKHKKLLTEKCLAPSLVKKPDPPNVKYLFNVTLNAAGILIARGVVEDRTTSRPEVLQCINDNFPVVRVPPPGQTVLVDIPFELP